MMFENDLRELLEVLADELIDKHEELDMKSTGDWIKSVEVTTKAFSGSILANDYTKQLVNGRGPGNLPPVNPIERWVNAKLNISGPQARQVAWAVAQKIKNTGTSWYQEGGSDLVDSVITQERVNKLFSDLGNIVAFSVAENLQRQLQILYAA